MTTLRHGVGGGASREDARARAGARESVKGEMGRVWKDDDDREATHETRLRTRTDRAGRAKFRDRGVK